jgi:hypothetical protein
MLAPAPNFSADLHPSLIPVLMAAIPIGPGGIAKMKPTAIPTIIAEIIRLQATKLSLM